MSAMRVGSGPMPRAERGPRSAQGASGSSNQKRVSAEAWREAKVLVWAHRQRLSLGLALMLVNRTSGLVLPWTTKYLIDEVIGKQREDLLPRIVAAAAAATLVQAVTTFALSQVLGIAAQRAITDMRRQVQEHVTRLPVRYFDSTQTGILISRIMSDAEGIRNLVGTGLVQFTGSIVTALLALGVLLYLDWKLTLINIVVLSVFAAAITWTFQYVRPLFRERGQINAEVTGRLTESLGGIRVVKAYTAERREHRVFTHGANRLFRVIARTMTGVSGITAFSTVIVGVVGVIVMLFGSRAILAHTMTLGGMIMYVSFTAMLAGPLVQLSAIGTQISEAFAGLDRIRDIRRMATEDENEGALAPLHDIRGDVIFEDVSFEYNPGVPVLKHVSLHAPAGSTTALVGSSGSGKSTLIGLIMAFHRPLSGRILIDGRDLSGIRLHDYRSRLGVVLQENFLFDGTIADNISFSRPGATRAEIEEAGRIAHCDEFVNGFEKGYDTVVGERGIKLSGGQRQRVSIARAIIADPVFLILDEATSSLDSESEAMIQDGLSRLRHGRTTFVIAHRLSTIQSADQILVIEGGEIVERGTHEQLLSQNGRYRQLYEKQYRIERDRFINPGEDWTPEPQKVKPISERDDSSQVPSL
jgi:subfamily B ATP-binding cassette protein MsbA